MSVAQVADATGVAQHRLVAGSLTPLRTIRRLAVTARAMALCWGVLAALVAAAADAVHLGNCCLKLLQASLVVENGAFAIADVNIQGWLLLLYGSCRRLAL